MNQRPVLSLALACLLGEAIWLPELSKSLKLLLLLIFLISLFYSYLKDEITLFFLCLLLVCSGISALRYHQVSKELKLYQGRIAAFSENMVKVEGVVSENQSAKGKGSLRLKDCKLSNAYGSPEALPENTPSALRERYGQGVGDILVYLEEEAELFPGQRVCIMGKMMPAEEAFNEGEFSFSAYQSFMGVSGSMGGKEICSVGGAAQPYRSVLVGLRRALQGRLRELCREEDSGIYQAILLGAKQEMDSELRTLYQKNGISHILAVSGLHLSILGSGFYQLLRHLGLGPGAAGALGGLWVLSYGILTGSSASALRASYMLLLRFLSLKLGRSYDMLSELSFACILLLLENPLLLYHSGFQLSFLAVLSLGLFSQLPKTDSGFLNIFLGSLYLQLFLLPPTLFHYFAVPLYSIFLNLLVLPLFTWVVYGGLAGLLFGAVGDGKISAVFFNGGHGILTLYSYLCTKVEKLPGAYLNLGRPKLMHIFFYYISFLFLSSVLLLWKKPKEARTSGAKVSGKYPCPYRNRMKLFFLSFSLFILSLLLLPRRAPRGLEITALYVGQGDGFLIREGERVISVDMGSSSRKNLGKQLIKPYLQSQGISGIDLSIISHCDSDHISGIMDLLEEGEMSIGTMLLPGVAKGDKRYDKLRSAAKSRGTKIGYLRAGDEILVGEGLQIQCYFPINEEYMEDANSHSSGLLLSYGDFRMLFTGDMPKEKEAGMLAAMESCGELPDIDILKVGHHGSHTSTGEELLRALRPELALLSYGRGNSYGHPHRETVELLEDFGVGCLETGKLGELRIESDGEEYRVLAPRRIP